MNISEHEYINVGDQVYTIGGYGSYRERVGRSYGSNEAEVDGPFIVEGKSAAGRLKVSKYQGTNGYTDTIYYKTRKEVVQLILSRCITRQQALQDQMNREEKFQANLEKDIEGSSV
jgi:hypothetical protein